MAKLACMLDLCAVVALTGLACASRAPQSPDGAVVQLLVDPRAPAHRPRLPGALNRDGMVVAGLFRVCADRDGKVSDVAVLESADPRVDESWKRTLSTWRYQPFVAAGVAIPLCQKVRVSVTGNS